MPIAAGSTSMFHTFQGLAPPQPASDGAQDASKPSSDTTAKRITTPHACAECKRRKIRCDGRQPCGQCLGSRSPKPCYYDKHRQRVIPSRKTLDTLQQSLDECRLILNRLYPSRDHKSLVPLSRDDLISLLDHNSSVSLDTTSPAKSQSSALSQEFASSDRVSGDDRSLANLEQIPSRETEWDEDRRNRDPIPVESDDVNALSLSVDRQASYLGASSIKAALLVMVKIAPRLRSHLAPPTTNARQVVPQNTASTPRTAALLRPSPRVPWSSEGQTLIDAYFNRVQIFVPMLDEPSFRADYLAGQRNDPPWLALLNMVFTMGSIAAMKSDDHSHIIYYNRAKEHLGPDSFGGGHLETLQALALAGGFYLHYINRPNMANAIIGAALRMACALGLHRESTVDVGGSRAESRIADLRRRTWWSLFCLDTWASMTLGRPSLGRWGPAITIRPPEGAPDAKENSTTGQFIRIMPLIQNIKLAKIATQIQDLLAISPLPRVDERTALDARLVDWYDKLPWALISTDPCPESLYTARTCLKWRYQNMRIVLHRPVLLNLANRGSTYLASPDEITAAELCRATAKQTIEDISREWARNQISGWNGVWFMYQASMIPLVSIFWESWNHSKVREWQDQIEMVLDSFAEMVDWSLAARRSREVVAKMYEASKAPLTRQGSPGPPQTEPTNSLMGIGNENDIGQSEREMALRMEQHQLDENLIMEEVVFEGHNVWDLDGMLWGNLADGLDLPFDGISEMEYFDPSNDQYQGPYLMHD